MPSLRKLVLAATAGAFSISLVGAVGLAAPASAVDTSWGCGGWCATAPTPAE